MNEPTVINVIQGAREMMMWLALFGRLDDVAKVQAIVLEKGNRKWAVADVVGSHPHPESGWLTYYALWPQVDALGLCDGVGLLAVAEPGREAEVEAAFRRAADSFADLVQAHHWDERL